MKPESVLQEVKTPGMKYLLVTVGGHNLAISSSDVLEITPYVKPTKLPFVPHYISGLVNVKGNVIPLLDLSAYMSLSVFYTFPAEKQVFVIILSGSSHFALTVDAVLDEVDMLERSTLLLDINQFHNIIHAAEGSSAGGGLLGKVNRQDDHEEEISLLVFQTLGERYGISLDEILEVIEIDSVTPITGAPACVSGLANLRDDALLILSFPLLLGRERNAETAHKLLIVIERDSVLYGIDVSASVSISTFLKNSVQSSKNEQSQFTQLFIDNENMATVFLKSDELIPDALHNKLKELVPKTSNKLQETINYKRVLHVTVNSLSYAIPLDVVRMVSSNNKIIKMNDSSKHVAGVIEIEGRIISVLDASAQLGLIDLHKTGLQYVIVGNDEMEWAVPVTYINEIVDIPQLDIESIDSSDFKHLSGIAHHQGQLIPVLNVSELFNHVY